jgi:hypothetical protein
LLLPSVDGIAQFHGKGIFPLLAIFLHCSPDGIAQFYKTYGVRKRCQKSYHHSFCSPQSSSDGIAQLLAYGVWCEKKVSEKLPPQVLFT